MSRHRRQPSRALPVDFNVDEGDGPAAAKGATSLEGSQTPRGGRGDADGFGKGQEGQGKKPPPATGGRTSSEATGTKIFDGDKGGS